MYTCYCVILCTHGEKGDHHLFTVGDKVVAHPRHQNGVPWLVFPVPLHPLHGAVYKIKPQFLAVVTDSGKYLEDITKDDMLVPDRVKAWVLSFMCSDATLGKY